MWNVSYTHPELTQICDTSAKLHGQVRNKDGRPGTFSHVSDAQGRKPGARKDLIDPLPL